jgi:hypothetical protein
MAVTYSTAVKNTRLDAVTTAIDAGTGSPSAGSLQIGTAGMASVLAVIDFNSPTAAPAAAGGVLTFSMPQSDTEANATGTAAEAIIVDSDGTHSRLNVDHCRSDRHDKLGNHHARLI